MSLWKKIKGELIDIVEWLDPTNDTMVHRFERYGNEIKWGAKLIVREGQTAAFVNQGQLADIFGPGTYTLETKNLPILSTLLGWYHGFQSPFKAEVYFVSTRRFTDLKWGTKNPIMLRDAEFGPLRLRAFGTYAIRVKDAGVFLKEIVGTEGHFTTDGITNQLRNLIVSRFADILGESRIPVLDLAANYDELGKFITMRIQPEFEQYGLELTKMLVENISLPPKVEEALDKRTSMGVVGDLRKYTQFQAAEALEKAADNPGGMASGGMGMGIGFAMASQMGQAMAPGTAQPGAPAPPPLPAAATYYAAINNQQAGPFDVDAIRRKIAAKEITAETLVWKPGMPDWTPAGKVAELQQFLAATPPPLPPKA
ncbi:MAG: SPFH domain-containing protein [Planctomycetota bacterium]|nr:MAG: SPFH domain-containing protein [Planctomycetota bacterium]